MAIVFDAPVSPDALTTFVREVPTPANLALSSLLPTRNVLSNSVDWAEVTRTNRTARFRAFDGRIHVSERDGNAGSRVKLPPLSSSLAEGEYERLQLAFAQTGGTNQAALVGSIYDDATNLTREVQNRMEQAVGTVLTTGKMTIAENGVGLQADYTVPANHFVAPATPWTTPNLATATALTDLASWVDTYVATNGARPGSMLTSLRNTRFLQRNKEVIDATYGSTQGRTRVGLTELNDLLTSEGLPTLLDPYDYQVDVDGVSTRVTPEDKIAFLPQNVADLGAITYGISATALELVGAAQTDLSFENAAGIVGVVIKSGPTFRQVTYVDAVGMPVLTAARLLLVADVF